MIGRKESEQEWWILNYMVCFGLLRGQLAIKMARCQFSWMAFSINEIIMWC